MAAPKCRLQLKRVERHLESAMRSADARGYTGMTRSKGSLFDDPRVKSLMRKRDVLLKQCTHTVPGTPRRRRRRR